MTKVINLADVRKSKEPPYEEIADMLEVARESAEVLLIGLTLARSKDRERIDELSQLTIAINDLMSKMVMMGVKR